MVWECIVSDWMGEEIEVVAIAGETEEEPVCDEADTANESDELVDVG